MKKKLGVGLKDIINKATELARQCPDTHVLSISDREGDFYDLFERAEQTPGIKADWLVRMKFNSRATLDINGKRDHRLLHERIMEITPQQLVEFTIPDGRGQSVRTVEQELRLARLTQYPPTGRRGKLRCVPVTVTVLLAKERNPPKWIPPYLVVNE
ncbi:hypothetical protein ACFME5_004714 [Escherichia coli]